MHTLACLKKHHATWNRFELCNILYPFDLVTFSCDFPGQEVMALQAMRRSASRWLVKGLLRKNGSSPSRAALPEVPKQILSTKCAFLKVLMVLTDVSFEQTCNEPN